MVEKEHSPIGASSAERFFSCPGSVSLMQSVPQHPTGKDAATGTVAHLVAEKWGRSGVRHDRDILDEVGRSYVVDGHEIEVTEEMVEAVSVYINTIYHYLDSYRLQSTDGQYEHTFHLKHIHEDAYGTADYVLVVPLNRIIVIDYKHGKGVTVDVADNKQLKMYGLGAYYELPPSTRNDILYVEIVVVQPRKEHPDGFVRKRVFSVEELMAFEEELKAAIRRTETQTTTFKSGPYCKFCTAKAVCPAKRDDLERLADISFKNVEQEPLILPDLAKLSPERLGHLMANAEMFRDWCDSVISFCSLMARGGTEVPGYKLVAKFGNRRWIDEQTVIDRYKSEFGDKIFKKKLLSPNGLGTVLGKTRAGELKTLYEKPDKGSTLVRVGDERQKVDSAADLFTPVGGNANDDF